MSLKTKLTSLITTFVLLCSLLTVGVFAVKNTTFNVGGDIVFNVQGIEATITRGATAGFTADKTIGNAEGNILSDITLNNNMSAQDVADEFAPWSGLNLAFSDNVATIKLTITNTADEGADNYLDITALADATTKNNAKVSVVNDAGGITALLEPQQSASFTITFSVIDGEYSASLEGFSVNFDMQKKVLSDFDSYDADETLVYECDTTNKIATLTDGTSAEGEVVIPAYIQKDNIVCTVTSIGDNAFRMCEGLKTLEIPDSVTSIGEYVFCESGLASITIPDSVTNMGVSIFEGCESLINAIIGDGVTCIEYMAFSNCSSLKSVIIGECVTIIKYWAFRGCSSLTSLVIPDSVTIIEQEAFDDCESLETVYYTGTQEQWNALLENIEDGNDYLKNATLLPNYKG